MVVVVVGGGFGDLSCGFSCGCDLLGLISVMGLVLFLQVFLWVQQWWGGGVWMVVV